MNPPILPSRRIGAFSLRRDFTGSHYLNRECGNTGILAQREAEAEAQEGSALLRDTTILAILACADEAGTDVDTAASFLLSKGMRP